MNDQLISVVIPLVPHQRLPEALSSSLDAQTYPAIERIIVRGPNVQENRNQGARQARGDFLFFCDADVTLEPDCLARLYRGLITSAGASYSYCDYRRTGHFSGTMVSRPFNAERLKAYNFISTMSLIKRADFPGFNPAVQRLQDWDLWLTMLEQGKTGAYVRGALFTAHFAPDGISARGKEDALAAEAFVRSLHPKLYGR